MSSQLARYHLGILSRIHYECLACWLGVVLASYTGFTQDIQPIGWKSSGHPKQDSPWMSSPCAKYHLGILNRIHPGCLAFNYPHHLGIYPLNAPEIIRHPA